MAQKWLSPDGPVVHTFIGDPFGARSRPRGAVRTRGENGELEGPRGFKLGPRTFPCFPHQF